MRKQYVIGNWKLNGSRSQNAELLKKIQHHYVSDYSLDSNQVEVVVCPPTVYLQEVNAILRQGATDIKVGAQTASEYVTGAYTGEVSPQMLREIGCEFVLVGHSERRTLYNEDDAQVANKVASLLSEGLIPILCIGETLDEYELGETAKVVSQQLLSVIDEVGIQAFSKSVIAYEPVWAIGTGKVATPETVQSVHRVIRELLSEQGQAVTRDMSILYGGSVNASNAAQLFAQDDVDGALIGGVSLKPQEFTSICDTRAEKMTLKYNSA